MIYTVAIILTLDGVGRELYDSHTSGDDSFTVAYTVMFSMAFVEEAMLLMKRIWNIKELPNGSTYDEKDKTFHMFRGGAKLCTTIFVVVVCHNRYPSVLKSGRIQSVHLRVLVVSNAFPLASSVELYMSYCNLYRDKKDPERPGETHG